MYKATSTSPMTKEINGVKMRLTRKFLGELFPTCTKDCNELKAYKKGHSDFSHGRTYVKGIGFIPTPHDVRQEYFYTNPLK